jgi:hypothetical protein
VIVEIVKPIDELKRIAWDGAYEKRPLNEICSKQITIDIVGKRCVYINDHRVVGGKPYESENLPTDSRTLTIRDVLSAFSDEQLRAFMEERQSINSYCSGLRNFRDSMEEPKK